jgi:hypothetical protein
MSEVVSDAPCTSLPMLPRSPDREAGDGIDSRFAALIDQRFATFVGVAI